MKKPTKPTGPATLFELAMNDESQRHACRVADIKRMQAQLGLLDAFVSAAKAARLTLGTQEIHSWGAGKVIWLGGYSFSYTHNAKLAALLIEKGMREVERRDHPNGDYTLKLENGRLRVAICIDRRAVATAAPGGATCA